MSYYLHLNFLCLIIAFHFYPKAYQVHKARQAIFYTIVDYSLAFNLRKLHHNFLVCNLCSILSLALQEHFLGEPHTTVL